MYLHIFGSWVYIISFWNSIINIFDRVLQRQNLIYIYNPVMQANQFSSCQFFISTKAWQWKLLTEAFELRKSSSSSRQNAPIARTSTRFPESRIWRICIVWYRSDTIARRSSCKKTPILWAKLTKSLWKAFSSSTIPSSSLSEENIIRRIEREYKKPKKTKLTFGHIILLIKYRKKLEKDT